MINNNNEVAFLKKEIFEWVVAIAVAVVCVLLIQKFLFVTYTVSGDSMYPTLKNSEILITEMLLYSTQTRMMIM